MFILFSFKRFTIQILDQRTNDYWLQNINYGHEIIRDKVANSEEEKKQEERKNLKCQIKTSSEIGTNEDTIRKGTKRTKYFH